MYTSTEIFQYINSQIEKHGSLRGKIIFAYSDTDFFLTHHLTNGDEELNFLEALSVFLKFEDTRQFFLAFEGYIGEKPKEDSILVLTGNESNTPYFSQWLVERDASGKFTGFRDTEIADLDGATHNPLNLLRPTQKLSIQGAMQVLEKAKACPEKYIIKGL